MYIHATNCSSILDFRERDEDGRHGADHLVLPRARCHHFKESDNGLSLISPGVKFSRRKLPQAQRWQQSRAAKCQVNIDISALNSPNSTQYIIVQQYDMSSLFSRLAGRGDKPATLSSLAAGLEW